MPLQAIAQLAMCNRMRFFVKTRRAGRAQITATKTRLNMQMLKNLPQPVCTNTDWNAKYMPMICSGFVIQYLADESKLPV